MIKQLSTSEVAISTTDYDVEDLVKMREHLISLATAITCSQEPYLELADLMQMISLMENDCLKASN